MFMRKLSHVRPILGLCGAAVLAAAAIAAEPDAAEQQRVMEAIPASAPARAQKPRKLLIYDGNVNYGGHRSIVTANLAFKLMGQKTGAFETTISRDPQIFQAESLRQFDAVFFNNTVGNLFEDAVLRRNLAEFVFAGGGLMGVHGTSVAFTRWPGAVEDWPEFGLMLGARGANHRDSTERVFIKLDDPGHPINKVFGGEGFEYRDEFFRFQTVYSRQKVRVLLSIDTEKTDVNQGQARGPCIRADNDYALAWVRSYGRGRVFYCTIAHNPYVFWDSKMLQFYLAAAQFVLGDLDGPTTPSGRLTPELRAQERLGWRLGLAAASDAQISLFDSIESAAAAGLLFIGADSRQKVSSQIPKELNSRLSGEDLEKIRLKLDAAGVRLLAYQLGVQPASMEEWASTLAFARKLGVETVLCRGPVRDLKTVGALAAQNGLRLALQGTPAELQAAAAAGPETVGVAVNLKDWLAAGRDAFEAARKFGPRMFYLEMHDLDRLRSGAREVSPGDGAGKLGQMLQWLRQSGHAPVMFGLEQKPGDADALKEKVVWFGKKAL